ncbi:MAG: TIGR03936 family radical SAM-associated protein [Lachnospiraceae bacterium]|nr:TIGR03936 family radical SAM-associated protein [Lachnospiraceae bacterium]
MFYDYRLKFSKNGPIRFVGHLDVMRYMQKANRRAGLPMCYSEGFSPHQILSLALPLSVGATSDGEYLDMRLTKEVLPDEIVNRLNEVMHEGIRAEACILLPEHAPKAMTLIAAARYRLTLRDAAFSGNPDGRISHNTDKERSLAAEDLAARLHTFLSQDRIAAVKTTKKGEQTIDLKPLIHEWEVAEDGALTAILHAGSRDHVKPALLYETFFRSIDRAFSPASLAVHRIDLYEEVPGENGVFRPLIEM